MENQDNQNQPEVSETETPKKNSLLPVVAVVLLLIFAGAYFVKNMKGGSSNPTPVATDDTSNQGADTAAPDTSLDVLTPTPTPSGPVKEFTVNGSSFKFSPATISVKKGDVVKITFKDEDGTHNLVVDGYNVKTNTLQGGSSEIITFAADKIGTFDYYCSVDSHREKGMVGKLTVK